MHRRKHEAEVIDGLKPLENEPRITKEYNNSFNKTDCKAILDSDKVDAVIVISCGALRKALE